MHAGPIDYATLPFVRVARLFAQMPLPVPEILHHDDALGVIGLQDLGDVTLQAHLGGASATDARLRYREAVGLIARLQQRGAELASPAYPPYGVAFDVEKLTWELEFFVRHFLLAYRGALPDEPVRDGAARGMGRHRRGAGRRAARAVPPRLPQPQPDAARRRALRHRFPGRAHGARHLRPGVAAARFLRRPPDAAVDELIDYFLALTAARRRRRPSGREFRRRFDLMALQRNLKALGTFGYQTTTRGNPVYMQYVPRTLAYVAPHARRATPRFGAAGRACSAGWSTSCGRIRRHAREPARAECPLRRLHATCSTSQRLDREHLVEIAAHGFDGVELFALRSHFDYRDPRRGGAAGRVARRHAAAADRGARADLPSACRRRWSGVISMAIGRRRRRARARRRSAADARASPRCSRSGTWCVHVGVPDDDGRARRQRRRGRAPQPRAIAADAGRLRRAGGARGACPTGCPRPTPGRADRRRARWADGGICLDVGHARLLGDPVDAIEAASGHIVAAHVHDTRGARDDHLVPYAARSTGPRALMAFQKIGYTGPWTFELAHGDRRRPRWPAPRTARQRFEQCLGINDELMSQ